MAKPKTKIVRQLRHGQITIPKEFRDELGLHDKDLLQLELEDGTLRVTAVRTAPRNAEWVTKLRADFAPFREAMGQKTDEDVAQVVEEALREVRESKRPRRKTG